uniref:Uncharacterized protein n=1 Tax=Capra hircus TaxID=9925 RepID=A0A452EML1_CAPHI
MLFIIYADVCQCVGTVYSSSRCLMDTLITCTLHITFGSSGKLGYLWKLNLEERGEYRI